MKKIIGTSLIFLPSMIVIAALCVMFFPGVVPEAIKNATGLSQPVHETYGFELYFPKEICAEKADYWMSDERDPRPYSMNISGVSLINNGKATSREGIAIKFACTRDAPRYPDMSVMTVAYEKKSKDTPTHSKIFNNRN